MSYSSLNFYSIDMRIGLHLYFALPFTNLKRKKIYLFKFLFCESIKKVFFKHFRRIMTKQCKITNHSYFLRDLVFFLYCIAINLYKIITCYSRLIKTYTGTNTHKSVSVYFQWCSLIKGEKSNM